MTATAGPSARPDDLGHRAELGSRADLDGRYGRTPGRRRRSRWFAVAAAAAFVVVFAAWVVWAGLDGSGPSLEADTTGYDLSTDQVAVRFSLNVDPGTAVRCAVQALDDHFEVVGWKIVDVPPSTERVRSLTETLRTVSPANTGLISRCWLP